MSYTSHSVAVVGLSQIFLDLSLSFFFSRPCVCFFLLVGGNSNKISQFEGVTVFGKTTNENDSLLHKLLHLIHLWMNFPWNVVAITASSLCVCIVETCPKQPLHKCFHKQRCIPALYISACGHGVFLEFQHPTFPSTILPGSTCTKLSTLFRKTYINPKP